MRRNGWWIVPVLVVVGLPSLPRIKNVTPWGGEYAEGTVQPGGSPLEIDLSTIAE